jgi:multiple sugar transport system substrate-binding protein
MKKKTFTVLTSLLLVSSVTLTACGGGVTTDTGAQSSSSSPAASAAAKQVKLKFWGGVPVENGPAAVVEKWNKANPDIQVEYVRYVNDDSGNTKLDTALISKTDAPDLFVTYGDDRFAKRYNAGATAPLDELIAKEKFDVNAVIGNENVQKYGDKIHFLPGVKSVNAMIFNKSALDEIGAKTPETGWTFDEYLELTKKLTKGDRKGTYFDPAVARSMVSIALTLSKPKDGYFAADGTSNFNDPAVKKALEVHRAINENGYMVDWAQASVNKLNSQTELLTGKAAGVWAGLYLIRYIKDVKSFPHDFKVSFAPIPQITKGGNVNDAGFGDYISINKDSANKEAAFKFLKWYLEEGNNDMIPGGRIPSNKNADVEKVLSLLVGADANLFDMDSLKKLLQGNYTYVRNEITAALPELQTIAKEEEEKYVLKAQTLEKTIENMKTRGDQAIKAAKK